MLSLLFGTVGRVHRASCTNLKHVIAEGANDIKFTNRTINKTDEGLKQAHLINFSLLKSQIRKAT